MSWTKSRFFLLPALIAGIGLVACSDDKTTDKPNPTTKTPKVDSFTTSAASVALGGTVTLTWSVSNANTVSIVATPPGTALLENSTNLQSSVESAAITENTTFQLTATGENNKTATQQITVNVDVTQIQIVSFTANPNPAPENGTSMLNYNVLGATSVIITEGTTELLNTTTAVQSGSHQVTLSQASHTYKLTAANDSASAEETVTITAEVEAEITAFAVTPLSFSGADQDCTVTWEIAGATVQLFVNGTEDATFPAGNTGTHTVNVTQTSTFELRVTSAGSTETAIATVVKTVTETEPNDTATQAQDASGGGVEGSIADANDIDFYSVTVGQAGWIAAELSDGQGSCPFTGTPVLTLYDTDGTTVLGSNSFSSPSGCSMINPRFIDQPWAADLAAGTYFLSVEGDAVSYTLGVQVNTPGCGNGVLETSQGEECDMTNDPYCVNCEFVTAGDITPPGGTVTVNLPAEGGDFVLVQIQVTTPGSSITATTTDVGGSGCSVDTEMELYTQALDFLGESTGSGCASFDPMTDSFVTDLPAGNYLLLVITESGSGGSMSVQVTISDPACGNSIVETNSSPAEQCDDGNTAPGDGCTATCQMEPLGTVNGLDQDQTFSNAIDPAGNRDHYEIVMPQDGYIRAETGVPTVGVCEGEERDTRIYLLDSNLDELGNDDDIEYPDNPCSLIDPRSDDYAAVTAGTYYLRVQAFSASDVIPAYQVNIQTMGQGCGNDIIETGEECDDGNTADNDGCSAACAIEPIGTVTGLDQDQSFTSALPLEKIDFVKVVLPADGYIFAEVGAPTIGSCLTGTIAADTIMALFDSTMTQLGGDDDGGVDDCSKIDPAVATYAAVPAGTYWIGIAARSEVAAYTIQVRTFGVGCPNGVVEAGEQCDDGNQTNGDGCSNSCVFDGAIVGETEPNDTIANATASPVTIANDAIHGAAIDPMTDLDYYAVTVPANATLIAQTHTQSNDVNVCGGDTILTLLDASETELTDNDDISYPSNPCSLIDGTTDTAAQNLAAGTYYLKVESFSNGDVISPYFLTIQLQ